ncbi:MAG: hypothetical protein HY291_13450 [Planctomycetes bacterium]|nr:hypothetical protein [Planctomycetota bacterium]
MGRKRLHPQKPKHVAGGVAPTDASKSISWMTSDPATLFRTLSHKLGGVAKVARYLGCSRATAYNLIDGRKRWSAKYLQKALLLLGEHPVINVTATARGNFEIPDKDWKYIKPQALVMDCDGAFRILGNSMWPLVGDGQYVLYKNVEPEELATGDIVLVRMRSGETLIKAWYASPRKKQEVFLASLYRGPKEFRMDLFQPFPIEDLRQIRKVVGVWMG